MILASKGRFDRTVDVEERRAQRRPSVPSISTDEFLDATLDAWDIRPESAKRVGHPAPFPVELPQRLIELYTFKDDLVFDPFLGSGTTAVAAVRTGRRYAGYDVDPTYIRIAQERVAEEQHERRAAKSAQQTRMPVLPLTTHHAHRGARWDIRSGGSQPPVMALAGWRSDPEWLCGADRARWDADMDISDFCRAGSGLAGQFRAADVFLGEDGRLGRDVAIKSVWLAKAADPYVRRRFAGEGRAAARLSHNTVGVYDVGDDRTSPYLVTAR